MTFPGAAQDALASALDPGIDLSGILPYQDALRNPDKNLGLVVVMQSYGDDGLQTYRYATHAFSTDPDDSMANAFLDGRVSADFERRTTIPFAGDGIFGGLSSATFGAIQFENVDGGLDALADRAIDDRSVSVLAGEVTYSAIGKARYRLDQMGNLLTTRLEGWSFERGELGAGLMDQNRALQWPVQQRRFAGTGGEQGPATLKEKTKPRGYGRIRNAEPVAVDEGRLIYLLNDAPSQDLEAVFYGGNVLTGKVIRRDGGYNELKNVVPPPGGYAYSLRPQLWIRLGTEPQGVRVTCDFRGSLLDRRPSYTVESDDGSELEFGLSWTETTAGHGYSDSVGKIALHLLAESAGWGLDRIDGGSFAALDRELPYEAGLWLPLGDERTIAEAIETLCLGCGCHAGDTRHGDYGMWRYTGPASDPMRSFTEDDILEIRRRDLPYRVPPLKISAGYDRNRTRMGESEVVYAARDRLEELREEYRRTTVGDESRRARHPAAKEVRVDTVFSDVRGANDYAANMMTLTTPGRVLFEIAVPELTELSLGDTVRVTHPLHNLSAGKLLAIVGIADDFGRRETRLTLHG